MLQSINEFHKKTQLKQWSDGIAIQSPSGMQEASTKLHSQHMFGKKHGQSLPEPYHTRRETGNEPHKEDASQRNFF